MNLISLRQITESELPTLPQALSGRASGGFRSPAADHYEAPISLDDLVDLRAPHVWFGEAEGDSMSPAVS
jgi:DNA polymerase V